jgi:hypothetical protein
MVRDKFAGYAGTLGMSGATGEIDNLCNEYMAIYQYVLSVKATMESTTEWRNLLLYGTPVGSAAPLPTAFAVFNDPGHMIIGLIAKFREFREQMVAAPGYTQSIGEDLMIATPQGEAPDAPSVKPGLVCSMSQSGGFEFGALASGRGEATMWELFAAPVGTNDYQSLGTREGKGATFVWPGTGNQPIQLQCKIQLKRKNENYGQPSDIVLVTVIP